MRRAAAVSITLLALLAAVGCGGSSADDAGQGGDQASDVSAGDSSGRPTTDDGPEDGSADPVDTDPSDAAPGDVDYSDLAGYDCEYLLPLVENAAGPSDREGKDFDPAWLTGTLQGGCEVTGPDAVAIEVHLAETDRYSLPFALRRPDRAAERAAQVIDIGDEAYTDADRPAVAARMGRVEVSLLPPAFHDDTEPVMALETMQTLAAAILAPWPSGPGPIIDPAAVPDIPLPAGADLVDASTFDPAEANQEIVDAGGNAVYDVDVMPALWFLPFNADATGVDEYCTVLRDAGFSEVPLHQLAEQYGDDTSRDSDSWDGVGCYGANGKWFLTVSPEDDGALLMVSRWDAMVLQARLCNEDPERCEDL